MGLEKTITYSVPVITPKNEAYPNEAEELFAEAQKMAFFQDIDFFFAGIITFLKKSCIFAKFFGTRLFEIRKRYARLVIGNVRNF